jgi:hypothetical protein
MSIARSIVEWVAFALLRLAATGEAVSGIAFLAASGAVQAAGAVGGANAGWVRLVIGGSLGVAVVLLITGGISLYLRRATLTWLPDVPGSSQASTRSGFDGWLILFPLTLLAVPALMLVQLQPLLAFWRDVLALADRLNFWEELQRNTADSGYVLIPVFSALALPGIAAAAAAANLVESVLLIALLCVRSARVPRALLLCVILQGGLVVTTVVGAAIVDRLTPSIEQLIRSTPDPRGTEQAQFLTAIERYSAVVRGASRTLAWGWAAMVTWTPLLLLSPLGRATFAAIPRPTLSADRALDYSAMDDEARERAYRDAANRVDRTTHASRWS